VKSFPILLLAQVADYEDYASSSISARGKKAIFGAVIAMRLNVLVLDGVFDLGLCAVLDAFQTANELIEM